MKRKIAWLLVSYLIVLSLMLVSCGGSPPTASDTATTTADTSQETKTTATTTADTSKTTSGDTLDEILSRAPDMSSVKYTIVITAPGVPATTTETWLKGKKMRIEMSVQGMDTIGLFDYDANVMYTCMPVQNMAVKASIIQDQKPATQVSDSIADYNPTNLGTESIDGIVCQVFEYNLDGYMTKMWIWKDRGLPVRTEQTTPQGKTIVEYKSYDFSDIPDSMFELPSGVQIIQTGQ